MPFLWVLSFAGQCKELHRTQKVVQDIEIVYCIIPVVSFESFNTVKCTLKAVRLATAAPNIRYTTRAPVLYLDGPAGDPGDMSHRPRWLTTTLEIGNRIRKPAAVALLLLETIRSVSAQRPIQIVCGSLLGDQRLQRYPPIDQDITRSGKRQMVVRALSPPLRILSTEPNYRADLWRDLSVQLYSTTKILFVSWRTC